MDPKLEYGIKLVYSFIESVLKESLILNVVNLYFWNEFKYFSIVYRSVVIY